ncbi:MAG TPA: hypothetical protein VGA89_00430 [Patescibacteria group bacterium]|jgi:hypothetical protein
MRSNFLLKLSKLGNNFFKQKHGVFWFSSRELVMIWQNKKKRYPLPIPAGFATGQVADLNQAADTIAKLCYSTDPKSTSPFSVQSATVFVASVSSPLERQITRKAFQQAGFQKVNLLTYSTALKTFAARQAIHTGVGLYIGWDVSEAVVFTASDQQSFTFNWQKADQEQEIAEFLQLEHSLAISPLMVSRLYQAIGQNIKLQSFSVRGKSLQTQQVMTLTLTSEQLKTLRARLETNLKRAWRQLTINQLFTTTALSAWLVVGDPFVYHFIQEQAEKSLFLHSELELIQGVQWL